MIFLDGKKFIELGTLEFPEKFSKYKEKFMYVISTKEEYKYLEIKK